MNLQKYDRVLNDAHKILKELRKTSLDLLLAEDPRPEQTQDFISRVNQFATEFNDAVAMLVYKPENEAANVYICPYTACGKKVEGKNYILLGTEHYHVDCYQRMLADNRERDELWRRLLNVEKELAVIRKERLTRATGTADDNKEDCRDGACKVL